MLRSLYSGVSGMRGFQTKMDVIANNIANANTTAFKSSRSRFQDVISQTTASAQRGNAVGLGGINARQIGLGMKVGSIDAIMTGGNLQPTNRELDFAIEKEGFFVVSNGGLDSVFGLETDDLGRVIFGEREAQVFYTRDGGFYKDPDGNLLNANGQRVLGVNISEEEVTIAELGDEANIEDGAELQGIVIPDRHPSNEDLELESFSVDGSGLVVGVYSDGEAYVLGRVAIVKFSNPEGLMKVGGNNYTESNNSGPAMVGQAGANGYGTIQQGFLEMSNVDLANEFTEMIIASRAYSANSRSITTSDEMLQELLSLKR